MLSELMEEEKCCLSQNTFWQDQENYKTHSLAIHTVRKTSSMHVYILSHLNKIHHQAYTYLHTSMCVYACMHEQITCISLLIYAHTLYLQGPPVVGILTRHDFMAEHILSLFPHLSHSKWKRLRVRPSLIMKAVEWGNFWRPSRF